MGSASEVEYHFLLACDLGYVTDDDRPISGAVQEVKRMLTGLKRKLKPK